MAVGPEFNLLVSDSGIWLKDWTEVIFQWKEQR